MNALHGILLLDKSMDMTSNAALQKAKRLLGVKKAGHTGSLDPLATGMLPLCFGEATKFAHYLLESDKYYRVQAKLGVTTTTGDAEGEVVSSQAVPSLTEAELIKILRSFIGDIQQIPPMYSAIKHQGRPLYQFARRGIQVERKPRTVHIHSVNLISYQMDHFIFDVHCSKGTYIRTLVEAIGQQIGCGAYVAELRRLAVAPYQTQPMYSLQTLSEKFTQEGLSGLHACLLPMETALQHFPAVTLSADAAYYFRQGQSVHVSPAPREGTVKVMMHAGAFMGLGVMQDDGRVAPKRLVSVKNAG